MEQETSSKLISWRLSV